MLSLHTARHRARKPTRPPKIGLAVAGGGPIGGMYELGALRALDEAHRRPRPHPPGLLRRRQLAAPSSPRAWPTAWARPRCAGSSSPATATTCSSARRPSCARPSSNTCAAPRALPRLATDWWRDCCSGRGDSRWSDCAHALRRAGADRPVRQRRDRALPARRVHPPRPQQRFPRARPRRCSWSRSTSTAARPCASAAKAGTTCRSRAPCRPAPPCPACTRRWTSCAAATSSTARCAARCTPRWCWTAAST